MRLLLLVVMCVVLAAVITLTILFLRGSSVWGLYG